MPNPTTIICPHCTHEISLDTVLTNQIQTDLTKQFEEKLQKEKAQLWKIAQEKAAEKIKAQSDGELKQLRDDLLEERKKREAAQMAELEIRKLKNKLDEEKQNFELEKQRQLDAERTKIEERVIKVISEEQALKFAEKDKVINDLKKSLDDAQRKAQQGSQQLQGEVQELGLEALFKSEFPLDEINPVGKGIQGADITQRVFDRSGRHCGTITWESKRTKAWSDGWISKLKDDQRAMHADLAVIVTNVLPTDIKNFGPKDGIYVTNFESALGVAYLLRNTLMQISLQKQLNSGKHEKMEVLYTYLTGIEFRQRMEAIVESFTHMKAELEQEKRALLKIWAKREKQISQVLDNTVGLHGDLQGLMGSALPNIQQLELPDSEEISID